MSCYLVSTKLDPSVVDMTKLISTLKEYGWNSTIIFSGYEDEVYSYSKQLKYQYGGSWYLFGTRDFSEDLSSLTLTDLSQKQSSLKLLSANIDYESGDGFSDWIYSNHEDDDMVDEYKQSVDKPVYDALEASKHFCNISSDDEVINEFDFCKDMAFCFAQLLGTAICKCKDSTEEIYSTFEIVFGRENLKEAAIKSAKKLLDLPSKELKNIEALNLLQCLVERLPENVYHYDPECIDRPTSYVLLLKAHLSITGLDSKIKSMNCEYMDGNSKIKLQFTIGKEKEEWVFDQVNDWVAQEFYVNLSNFVAARTKGKLAQLETSDQTIKVLFIESDIANYLCAEGVLQSWV